MKTTGPKKLETIKTIAALERHYRKTKQAIWLDIAERLKKPSRQRASINLWKLEKLCEIFDKKTLIVPGKILGFGEITKHVTVIALEYSADAKKKISEKKAKSMKPEKVIQKIEVVSSESFSVEGNFTDRKPVF